jgi:hypothetical protein
MPTFGDLARRFMHWLNPRRYYRAATGDVLGLRRLDPRDPQKLVTSQFRDDVQGELDMLRAELEYARLHPEEVRLFRRRRDDRKGGPRATD